MRFARAIAVITGLALACGGRSDLTFDEPTEVGGHDASVVEASDLDRSVPTDALFEDGGDVKEAGCVPPVAFDGSVLDGGSSEWWTKLLSPPGHAVRDHEGRYVISGDSSATFLQILGPAGNVLASKSFGAAWRPRFDVGGIAADDSSWGVAQIVEGEKLDFGGGALAGPAGVLLHFARDGAFLSQRVWPATTKNRPFPTSVGVLSNGDIVVVGTLVGTFDFGGGPLSTTADASIFLVRYRACGEYVFGKVFGTVGSQTARMIVDASDRLVLYGSFTDALDFGGGPLVAPATPGQDLFVAMLDAQGNHVASRDFKTHGYFNTVYGLAVDSGGNVVVGGQFDPTIDVGAGPVSGTVDGFIVSLTSGLTPKWARLVSGPGAQLVSAVTTLADGSVTATGMVMWGVDFGGGTVPGNDNGQVFVAHYGADGSYLSAMTAKTSCCGSFGYAVLPSEQGKIVLMGVTKAPFTFGSFSVGVPSDFALRMAP